MWLFYSCFVMLPCTNLLNPPPPPPAHALFHVWRRICNNTCGLVIALVHLKAVFIAAKGVNVFFLLYFFLCWTQKQLPEVLSKFPVRGVRGYLYTLSLSTHAEPCSCFLWIVWSIGSNTQAHMFRKAKEKGFLKTSLISVLFPVGSMVCNL